MVEQTYTLHYLGCSVLSKGTTGLGVIQKPLKELYFSFRKKQTKTPTEVYMQITREGLNMLTPDGNGQGHQLKSTLYKFQQVSYVEAVLFTHKNNSRKTQFAFMPLDEKRAVTSPEKLFSTLEKKNSYLLKMNHQPIVVCLMRRQAGVKALDCHVFISLSPTDAMKIVDSFTHMEQLASQSEYKGEFRTVPPKANAPPPGSPWDGVHRPDYRPYTNPAYPASAIPDSNHPHDGRYQLRDEHFRGNVGADKLPKTSEQQISASFGGLNYHNHHPMAAGVAGGPMPNYPPRGYGEIQERGRPISSYFNQSSSQQQSPHQPPLSASHNLPVNHSRGSSYEERMRDYPPDPRYSYPRYEPMPISHSQDEQLWNAPGASPYERQTNDHGRPLSVAHAPQNNYNLAGSNNIAPMGRIDPRQALSTTDLPSQITRNSGVNAGPYSHIQEASHIPRREVRSASPTNSGPAFSASNLESRQQLNETNTAGGLTEAHSKPVAKVPPHKIAGVKVLPSSFELPKRPISPKPTYKNDDDPFWEKQKVQFRNQATNNNNNNNVPNNRYSNQFPLNNYGDYQHPGAAVINTKPGNYSQSPASDYYRNSSALPVSQSDIYSHYNNRYSHEYGNQNGNPPFVDRRYIGADFGGPPGMERRPHSYYDGDQSKTSGEKRKSEQANGAGDDMMRKKEAEIASMFQHMEIPSGNPRVPRYASQADLNFEQSLGYYP